VPLLDETSVVAYLAGRGVLPRPDEARARVLTGGVSNVVLAVEGGGCDVVVKQALEQLRVEQEWLATPERADTEAAALRLAERLLGDRVPGLVDADPESHTLTIALAPAGWRTWKDDLMAGDVDVPVAGALGQLLGELHARTLDDPALIERFGSWDAFRELRVDPFILAVARRRPELADELQTLVDEMQARSRVLVHGDFSPKNVLVADGGRVWLLDWEVAHVGDAGFDLGFLLGHLVLKALRRPGDRAALTQCAGRFLDAYGAAVPDALAPEPAHLGRHVAALVLARVDGKSTVDYLAEPARSRARELATTWLRRPPAEPLMLFEELETD
jgi:5-methylthioribose kinase